MQRTNVKHYLTHIFVVLVFASPIISLIIFFSLPKSEGIWINCGISEISPDFTTEMREACRQLRAKNNLQKPK